MKNKSKKTVLHVISTLKHGGTERYLINLLGETSEDYNNIILYYYGDNTWSDELANGSVKVYKWNNKKRFKNLHRISEIRKIIKQENVDIVYSYTYYNSIFVLLAACLAGVKKRIVHAHRISWDDEVAKVKVFISKLLISMMATDKLACSNAAGKSLFLGADYKVIKNGFHVSDFQYNEKARKVLRKQLGVDDDCILLGGVGRVEKNKNQGFMAEILNELLSRRVKCKLLLVGGSQNEDCKAFKELCKKAEIDDMVIIINEIDNVGNYYSAMDVLLVASFNESFSFVVLEGQANGVPILASETISPEIKHNENMRILKLEDGAKVWADGVMSYCGKRMVPSEQVAQYSTSAMAKSVMKIYKQMSIKHKQLEVGK